MQGGIRLFVNSDRGYIWSISKPVQYVLPYVEQLLHPICRLYAKNKNTYIQEAPCQFRAPPRFLHFPPGIVYPLLMKSPLPSTIPFSVFENKLLRLSLISTFRRLFFAFSSWRTLFVMFAVAAFLIAEVVVVVVVAVVAAASAAVVVVDEVVGRCFFRFLALPSGLSECVSPFSVSASARARNRFISSSSTGFIAMTFSGEYFSSHCSPTTTINHIISKKKTNTTVGMGDQGTRSLANKPSNTSRSPQQPP